MKSFSRELGRDANRDVGAARSPTQRRRRSAKRWVVAIGIDRYQDWRPLGNAVGDARGALAAFTKLGFEPFGNALLDEAATCSALHHLVNDQLRDLGSDDSLVLFFAGHGHTETTVYPDGTCFKAGYLIPVDADPRGGRVGSWLHLENWLKVVAHLQARHILVILDACHSGAALAPLIRWRGAAPAINEPLERLRIRRSRRVITSAQDDQLALDGGPVHGHSLFTGCLLESLGSIASNAGSFVTGTELGVHVQRRVMTYPLSKQTPDVGAFELDDRGELVLEQPNGTDRAHHNFNRTEDDRRRRPRPTDLSIDLIGGCEIRSDPRRVQRSEPRSDDRPTPEPGTSDRWSLPALQRQHEQRHRGEPVLTLAAGSSQTVLSGWSTWAAQRRHLTLITHADASEAVIRDLLMQMPWSRCVPAARAKLAASSDVAPEGILAELLARSGQERTRWIQNVAAGDPIAMISGWLLSAMCSPGVGAPDPDSAPLAGFELLLALCQLAQPIAILLQHPAPTAPWLVRAIATAAAIVGRAPGLPVAVTGPVQLVDEVLANHRSSAAMSMARQGLVQIEAAPPSSPDRDGLARQRLHVALARDARTTGRFERNVKVPIHDLPRWLEVNLVARSACLIIEIDDWYQRGDPQAYHRDRLEDVRLQRAGFFPMRFLIDDIEQQLDRVVDAIAAELANRTALRSLSGDMP